MRTVLYKIYEALLKIADNLGTYITATSTDEFENKTLNNTNNTVVPSHPYKAMASGLSSSLSLTTSYQRIKWNSVNLDPNGDYSSATGKYTCPVSGLYLINVFFRVDGLTDGDLIQLAVNFGGLKIINKNANSAEILTYTIIANCTAGDDIYCQVKNNDGERGNVSEVGANSQFAVSLLSI